MKIWYENLTNHSKKNYSSPNCDLQLGEVREGVECINEPRLKIFGHAKQLHRNMTQAEAKLWSHLRAHRMGDVHFRNHTCPGGRCQGHTIGKYVVDFCSPRKILIIELDGSQHLEQEQYDEERTTFLKSKGYRIMRFWNNDVMNNLDSVLRAIYTSLNDQ